MMKVCVPESKIESVCFDRGKYYVRYFSGRQKVFTDPPASVRKLMQQTPTHEHMVCKYGDDKWECDFYRNYKEEE